MKNAVSITLAIFLFGMSASAEAGGFVHASGEFTVEIDFASLELTPVDENCLLTVEGVVRFTGTLQGFAPGRTRALALASCSDVAAVPPGTFEDVFTSALEFAGKIDGQPIVADLTYRGRTAVGGAIDAVIVLSNSARGRLFVDAIVAAGGTYSGYLKLTN